MSNALSIAGSMMEKWKPLLEEHSRENPDSKRCLDYCFLELDTGCSFIQSLKNMVAILKKLWLLLKLAADLVWSMYCWFCRHEKCKSCTVMEGSPQISEEHLEILLQYVHSLGRAWSGEAEAESEVEIPGYWIN